MLGFYEKNKKKCPGQTDYDINHTIMNSKITYKFNFWTRHLLNSQLVLEYIKKKHFYISELICAKLIRFETINKIIELNKKHIFKISDGQYVWTRHRRAINEARRGIFLVLALRSHNQCRIFICPYWCNDVWFQTAFR